MDGNQGQYIRKIMNEGISRIKNSASAINFSYTTYNIFNEKEFRNILHEPKLFATHGAIDSKKEFADGKEIFVRLSAFADDLRINKEKNVPSAGWFYNYNG